MILSELHRIQTIELKAHFYSISLFNFQRPVLVSSRSKNLFRSTCMVSTIVPTLKNVLRFSQSARYVYAPFRFRCQELFLFFLIFFQKVRSTPEQRSALMPLIPALVNLNLQFLKNYFNFNF